MKEVDIQAKIKIARDFYNLMDLAENLVRGKGQHAAETKKRKMTSKGTGFSGEGSVESESDAMDAFVSGGED